MPPSPQPDFGQNKPCLRRASSQPPESIRRSKSPVPLIKQVRLGVSTVQDDALEIEELSPEAIIPDSVNVMRDPEVEVPDDGEVTEEDLEKQFTTFQLDRMDDGSESEETGAKQSPSGGLAKSRKRKHTPPEDGEAKWTRRKKTTRTQDVKRWDV